MHRRYAVLALIGAIGAFMAPPVVRGHVKAQPAYGHVPLSFEINQGQSDPRVRFLVRGAGYTLFLTSSEAVLTLRAADPAVRIQLLGTNAAAEVSGLDPLPGKSHYFFGNDPMQWRHDIPTYARVGYKDIYDGIDLVYYGNQGQLEHDFIVSPGADPGRIRLGLAGAKSARLDSSGDLELTLAHGTIRLKKPYAYQREGERQHAVTVDYRLRPDGQAGFSIGRYDRSEPLIIDPVLVYSTYLGGNNSDFGSAIAVDATGAAYIVGSTSSTTFPTTPGAVQTTPSGIFVTKLNPEGSDVVYSTYLGSTDGATNSPAGIAVDASGNAYIAGFTQSAAFPTKNPIQPYRAGGGDAFIAKLNATGSDLVYSTFLGGDNTDSANAIAIDSAGNAYVTGSTYLPGSTYPFPTTANAYDGVGGNNYTTFVSKLDANGAALLYSTVFGSGGGEGAAIAADSAGNAYIVGGTSGVVPTTASAFQPVKPGAAESQTAFVVKLNTAPLSCTPTPAANCPESLIYSSYLHGGGIERPHGIALDAAGRIYVSGETLNGPTQFPTTAGVVQPLPGADSDDAFVAKIDPALSGASSLVYSTYLGGGAQDVGGGIAVDTQGNVYVVVTSCGDYPQVGPSLQSGGIYCLPGFIDNAFLTKLNADASAVIFSTPIGGSATAGAGVALDGAGGVYVNGTTDRYLETTIGAYRTGFQGGGPGTYDSFVLKIDDAPPAPPDLTIAKTHSGNFEAGQTGAQYTITVTNSGTGGVAAGNTVTVSDTPPSELTITAMSGPGWNCTQPAGPCTNSSALGAGASYSSIAVTVDVGANAPSSVTNAATVSGGGEANAANDSASDPTTIVRFADLVVTKTHQGRFIPGQAGAQYTLTVTNIGSGPTTGTVTLKDQPFFAGAFTFVSFAGTGWSCASLTCTRSDSLDAGASYPPAVLTVNVKNAAPASVTNGAVVSGGGETNTSNDSAGDVTPIGYPDLIVAKTHAPSFVQGQVGAQFTLRAGVTRMAPEAPVTLTDALPSGLTATAMAGDGWNCDVNALACSRSDTLAANTYYPDVTLTVDVAADAALNVINTATVSGGGEIDATNDSASNLITIAPAGGIAPVSFASGNPINICTSVGLATADFNGDGKLDVASACRVSVVYMAFGNGDGTFQPAFTFSTGGQVPSAIGAGDFNGDGKPDIALSFIATNLVKLFFNDGTGHFPSATIAALPSSTHPGLAVADFNGDQKPDLAVTNGQPKSVAILLGVGDGTFQPYAAYSTGAASSPSAVASGDVNGDGKIDLVVGNTTGSVSVLLGNGLGSFGAAALYPVASGPIAVLDFNGDGRDDVAVAHPSTNPLNAPTGDGSVGILLASGDGTLQPTIAYDGGISPSAIVAGDFTMRGTIDLAVVDTAANTVNILAGMGDGTFYPNAILPFGSNTLAPMIATRLFDAGTSPDLAISFEDGGTYAIANTTLVPDLTIAKTHAGNFTQGQSGAQYAITVSNSGTGPTSGTVSVVDALPAGLTAVSIAGSGWSCTLAPLACSRGDALAASASYPAITLTVNVAGNAGASLTNIAAVSGGGEANLGNDSASDPTTVIQVADLTIAKSHIGTFSRGQTGAVYSIVVSNAGSVASSGTVSVTDTLPAALTKTAIAGSGWNCSLATLTCTRADALGPGAAYSAITVTASVAANAPGSLTNVASVSGGGEVNTGNDTASDPTVVLVPDLTVTSTHVGSFVQGQSGAQYAITVKNIGTASATGTVTVAESIPAGLTATGISGTGWKCTKPSGPCTQSATLAAGASFPILTLSVNVASDAGDLATGTVTNVVSVSGGSESDTSNDTAADPTTILVPVTVTTSPPGRSFTVDGVTYTSAQQFNWTRPVNHTLSTTVSQSAPGSTFSFVNWTAGQTTLTTPAFNTVANIPTTYTVNFSAQYQLTTVVSPAAAGSVTPASGGYYPAGAVVNLSATAAPGHSFFKWSGPVAKANSATTTVTMTQPQTVTATFK